MGVTGLWRLIEPAGKPVPVETLENKVLAVDISIWLHQMVKGYQDAKGAPLPNAHLIGLFQRLCKLLYFRIKPVFVFDGAFPALKRETIAKRQEHKQKYNSESERLKRELAVLLTKKSAISTLLGKQISPKKASNTNQNDDDIFKLPALPENEESESESEDEASTSSGSLVDLHSVDLESQNFKSLQPKEKYELLLELKETRKMNSWGKLHELPKKSDNFSDFQLQRLLKRRKVQECLEETEKEIGDAGMSLIELESLLNEEGIDTKIDNLPTKRIASNNTTRYLLINDVKQALADAKKKKESEALALTSDPRTSEKDVNVLAKKDELEEDLEKAIIMSLGGANDAETSACTSKTDDSWTSYMSDSEYSVTDSEEEDGFAAPDLSSAKAYIMQYCDFTDKAIDKIVSNSVVTKSKNIKPKLNEIIEEINSEKSVIVDNVELSSSDDECNNQNIDSDVQVNTTIGWPTDQSVNATQASVIIEEDKSQEVITLDSSLEESPVINDTNEEKQQSNSNMKEFEHVPQIEQKLSETKNILKTVPKTSIKFPMDLHNKESSSSDSDFDDTHQNEQTVPKPCRNEEPDSSDDDFEDVPELDNKPVVQLTLKMNAAPENDIFADVFTKKPDEIENLGQENIVPNESKLDQVINSQEDDDDELQKAIMMSLECAVEDNAAPMNVSEGNKIVVTPNKDQEPKIMDSTGKDKPETSKTLESLNEIISAQLSKPATKEINKHINKITKDMTKETAQLSTEQLNVMVEEMEIEEQDLLQEKGRMDRVGRNITEQMTKEAQELLQIFGIPYIVAPMEAEAQCAFLESVNLTDGTITDDSDIWLFGGRTVYKNFFNQKKHVLQFLSERIERSFNLNREQLILLALLVGSDYTTGISGVGPVTALEILASFPLNRKKLIDDSTTQACYMQMITGLQEFKQWVRGGKRTDNTTLKKKLRNISVNDDFPSVRVVQAYLEPNIEKSEDKFSWGEIDITVLRDYTKKKFGWSQHKLDEIIKPVLKRLVERKSQKSMHDYFKKKINFLCLDDQMSKRVKAAVQRMGPELAEVEQPATRETKPAAKRKTSNSKETEVDKAGPSKGKKKRTDESVLKNVCVKVVSEVKDGKSEIDIKIHKTDRFQEIIPQREKDKQSLLQNKMKAIELFRKTKIDKKKKITKRKPILTKEKAELSESSDSN